MAQRRHEAGLVERKGAGPIERAPDSRIGLVEPVGEQALQKLRLGETTVRQERAVAEERGEEPAPGFVLGQPAHESAERRGGFVRFLLPAREPNLGRTRIRRRRQRAERVQEVRHPRAITPLARARGACGRRTA